MNKFNLLVVFLLNLAALQSLAHADRTAAVGLGFYSQNSFHEITKTNDGRPEILGVTSFPLLARYEWNFHRQLFLSPTILYTPIPRNPKGNSYNVRMFHVLLPIGGAVVTEGDYSIDWEAGLGFAKYYYKGKGGLKVLSNGGGTSTFASPGRSVSATNATINLGMAYNIREKHRFGVNLIFEGALSSKRTQSLMLSYAFRVGARQI